MSYTPSFAIINAQEVQRLNTEGASASVISVYLALCAFAQRDDFCFPSLNTIKEWVQGSMTISTISKALRWLREKKFIEQNHRTSKERFNLTYRKVVKATSKLVQRAKERVKDFVQTDNRVFCVQTDNRPKNQKGKPFFRKKDKNSYRKKWAMGYGRFSSQNDGDNERKCEAETTFENWVIQNPDRNIKTLSTAETSVIIKALTSTCPHDKEWREIMAYSPNNKATFDLLLKDRELSSVV